MVRPEELEWSREGALRWTRTAGGRPRTAVFSAKATLPNFGIPREMKDGDESARPSFLTWASKGGSNAPPQSLTVYCLHIKSEFSSSFSFNLRLFGEAVAMLPLEPALPRRQARRRCVPCGVWGSSRGSTTSMCGWEHGVSRYPMRLLRRFLLELGPLRLSSSRMPVASVVSRNLHD